MPTIKVPELSSKYTAIVNGTDGLVSVAPSCARALDKVGQSATESHLKAAIHALEAQANDAEKGLPKGDAKAAKSFKAFEKAINDLVADIKKISKGVAEIHAALR
jgi:hypothetical protein